MKKNSNKLLENYLILISLHMFHRSIILKLLQNAILIEEALFYTCQAIEKDEVEVYFKIVLSQDYMEERELLLQIP